MEKGKDVSNLRTTLRGGHGGRHLESQPWGGGWGCEF